MTKPDMFSEAEAAAYIGMSVAYLRADRIRGHVGNRTPGPAFLRLGRSIRYRREDLDGWLDRCRVERKPREPAAA